MMDTSSSVEPRETCLQAAGAQRGIQALTTAANQFSCADMKLSAAQVFGREDEDGGGAY